MQHGLSHQVNDAFFGYGIGASRLPEAQFPNIRAGRCCFAIGKETIPA